MTKKLNTILFLLLCSFTCFANQIKDLKPTVILISLDGFRYDYLDKYQPKTLNQLAKNGVRAKWMIPSFPTKTFPNHYTIATGLYPAHHGIVENSVYDFGVVFSMSKREEVANPRWWLGEPIWVTAEKNGQKSASYFFPGTETKIQGIQPANWRIYNGKVPNEMRVDEVLSYLDYPKEQRPTIITMYFSDVDDAGHEFGPDAKETKYAVWKVDNEIKRLMDGLKKRNIDKKVNVIIVSDHGMKSYYTKTVTFLDDYFDLKLAEQILWNNEIVQIFPNEGKTDEIFSKINNLPHTTCWKKADIPDRLKYKDGARVAPIICSSKPGWMTTNRSWYNNWIKGLDDKDRPRGAHGYDNNNQEMQATFIAHGGSFRKGVVTEPFENVNVYNLMCKILGLPPAKNDGNHDLSKEMLKF